jgi:hypothetical protein
MPVALFFSWLSSTANPNVPSTRALLNSFASSTQSDSKMTIVTSGINVILFIHYLLHPQSCSNTTADIKDGNSPLMSSSSSGLKLLTAWYGAYTSSGFAPATKLTFGSSSRAVAVAMDKYDGVAPSTYPSTL